MMEIEFDKEMDAILRQARKGETAFSEANSKFQTSNSNLRHLDADEISAFAENALPEKAKQNYTAHLADCDLCRKALSNLILLNVEPETADAHVEEIAAISSTPSWYRRIFAFPNLAYTMGGLVLVFSGIAAFMVVQNLNNSQVSEISQINEKTQPNREIISESNSPQAEPGLSNSANTNTSTVYAPSATPDSLTDKVASNSNMSVAAAAKPVGSPSTMPKDEPRPASSLPVESKKNESFSVDGQEERNRSDDLSASAAPPPPSPRRAEKEQPAVSDKSADSDRKAPADSMIASGQVNELPVNGRRTADLQLSSAAKKAKNAETSTRESTAVGGKTFNRRNNVWYDAAYNQQPTVNITRGTKQYKKLDKDLRLTVENLGGTVVIVWKDKAYRIQ